jgi:hypothetical protein
MKDVLVSLPVLPGDRVLVENYKSSRKPWEPGVVENVEASFLDDGSYRLGYRVLLDRRSKPNRWNENGYPLRLHLSARQISGEK